MSKIMNNPIMKGASGMLGDVVVYREVRGNLIMSNRPKRGRILTPTHEEAGSEKWKDFVYISSPSSLLIKYSSHEYFWRQLQILNA